MKVVLYMAITPNGMIAKENDNTGWVTETEWVSFSGMIKESGNMIIGRRTYDVMLKNDEFKQSGLEKIKTVVLSSEKTLHVHDKESISVAKSPKEAIGILQGQGFETIMVCGGGGLNSSFIKENLVDEIYLDIEPIVFGKGTSLFREADFEANLELIETKKLSPNEIQLHYRVRK
jgi:dihydrofolate reductase